MGLGEIDVTHVMPEAVLDEARAEIPPEVPQERGLEALKGMLANNSLHKSMAALFGGSGPISGTMATMPGPVLRDTAFDGQINAYEDVSPDDGDDWPF